MADNDDFEIIDETGLSNELVFEFIDVKDVTGKNTGNPSEPTTPDVVLPFLVPKPLVNEIPQVVQQQIPSPVVVNPPELQESYSPIKTTTLSRPFIQIKKTTPPPPSSPIIFALVPPLPKAPPLQRYGDAAYIPHNLDEPLDIDGIINKTRKNQQNTLNISTQQQQDIQTVLEQRRELFKTKNNF